MEQVIRTNPMCDMLLQRLVDLGVPLLHQWDTTGHLGLMAKLDFDRDVARYSGALAKVSGQIQIQIPNTNAPHMVAGAASWLGLSTALQCSASLRCAALH